MIGLLRISSSAHGAEITSWGGFDGRRPNLTISVALRINDVVLLGGLSVRVRKSDEHNLPRVAHGDGQEGMVGQTPRRR
jgi:hypothetical protein